MLFLNLFLAFACCISPIAGQLSLANLTSCGLSCLVVTVPEAGCSLTNSTCQCESKSLAQATAACLLQNCTMQDSLDVSKVQASICRLPSEERSNIIIAITATAFAVTSVFVLARFLTKGWLSGVIGFDDWIIGAALVLSIPSVYFAVTMSTQGFGKHVWDLMDGDLSKILRSFYISENIYVMILGLVKLSILVFYLPIFPQTWFRYSAYGAIVFISLSTTIISFLTIFQCKPIAYFWNRDLHGTCINLNALAYANSAMSIVQDVLIVALPTPALSKLHLGRKKKIGLIFMFAVGSFGCIISMIRLKSLLSFGNSIDPTWDYTMVVIWTTLELAVAMICACLPSIRRLLVRVYPKAFASSDQYSNENQQPSDSWFTPTPKPGGGGVKNDFVELEDVETHDDIAREGVRLSKDREHSQRTLHMEAIVTTFYDGDSK